MEHEQPNAAKSVSYWGHTIDLSVGSEDLFKNLKSSVRSGVRKAQRAGLHVEFGVDLESTQRFFRLHCLTRRRHGMPCQSVKFFENIAKLMLANGKGFMATVWQGDRAVAAAMFFHQGTEAFYKFGASDYKYQHFRPNNLLMWESIKKCSEEGFTRLHLGRTSLNQHGLRRFKLGFGAREEQIAYYKYDYRKGSFVTGLDYAESRWSCVLQFMPPLALRLLGRLAYRELA
ncbi:MAG TPA: peptidoglycan bridge formation glycyltransferase FemA/FemB family protein [Verrucomicrobiae bacterium]|nr:peptidoglycan bridge formation glycyltransferase FemA/FemB family protein [Verrucomicrobiae bacterium]